MSGWPWGELRFDGATVGPYDILGQPGEGMPLLRHHFARYHPLVIAGGSLMPDASSTWQLAGSPTASQVLRRIRHPPAVHREIPRRGVRPYKAVGSHFA